MKTFELENKIVVDDILATYKNACKPRTDYKVGVEFERIPVDNNDFSTVSYYNNKGVLNFLKRFGAEYGWDYIFDDCSIIGLKKCHDSITLEPGSQIELSLEPENSILKMKNKIDTLNSQMSELLDEFGFSLLEYGVSPKTTYKTITLLPKRRYGAMAGYLWGILSDVMMRETAGVQICLDYESEDDASNKFRLANMLSPFTTAIFANSPIRGGVDTGYKTFRALAWLNTDNERCGFASRFQRDFGFKDYINEVLSIPMIFIQRGSEIVKIRGRLKFDEFMKYGYLGHSATVEDFQLHANMYFPEVRLRNYIEIRNHDCVNKNMVYSLMAYYKGLFYSKGALNALDDLLSEFTYSDISEFRYNVPKCGLETQIKYENVKDIAREIMRISYAGLKELGQGEESFLEPIMQFAEDGITPADIILLNWNGRWNKDISKLIKYLKTC